jgi:hypothetical protein
MNIKPLPKDPVKRLFAASELIMQKFIHKEAMKFVANREELRKAVKAEIKRRTVRVKSTLP